MSPMTCEEGENGGNEFGLSGLAGCGALMNDSHPKGHS